MDAAESCATNYCVGKPYLSSVLHSCNAVISAYQELITFSNYTTHRLHLLSPLAADCLVTTDVAYSIHFLTTHSCHTGLILLIQTVEGFRSYAKRHFSLFIRRSALKNQLST